MRRTQGLVAVIIGGALFTAIAVKASSPDAWKQHYQKVNGTPPCNGGACVDRLPR